MKPSELPVGVAPAPPRVPFLRSLRARFLALALGGLVLFAAISIFDALRERAHAEEGARLRASVLAQEAAARLDEHFEKFETVLALASVSIMPHLDDVAALDGVLRAVHQQTLPQSVFGLSLFSPEGRMIASANVPRAARAGIDVASRGFFRGAADQRRFTVGEPFVSSTFKKPIFVAGRPVVDASGRLRGVISVASAVEAIEHIATPALAPRGSLAAIHLADGTLVAGHEWPDAQGAAFRGEARALRSGWRLTVAIPAAVVLADSNAIMRQNVIAMLVGGVILGLLTLWAGARVSRPIERLRAGAARLAAGDLAHRVVAGGDAEMVQLERDFNAMADELERQRDARLESEHRLARLGRMHAVLSALNETIARIESPEALYREVCEIAVAQSGLRLALMRLVDPERRCLTVVAQSGPQLSYHQDVPIPADPRDIDPRRIALLALSEGRLMLQNDIRRAAAGTSWGDASIANGILATVSCPVRRGGRVVGLLSLFANEAGYFDDASLALVERMSASLEFALDNFDRDRERRSAEERVRASEERFRALTELSSDWYWEQDEQLRFTFMSGGLGEKTGIRAEDYIGKTRWDFPALNLTAADWARHRALLERHEPFYDFELRRPDAENGQQRWMVVSGRPLFDADGRFKGYHGTGRDITGRKIAEDALAQLLVEKDALAERLRRQFESMPIGCVLTDAQYRVIYVNPAAEKLFGVPAAELLGADTLPKYLDPGIKPAIMVRRQRLEADEPVGPMVMAIHRPDGAVRRCEVHSTAIQREGKFDGVIRMMIDVTEREQAQAALRESESRYRSLIEVAPDGIVLVRDGAIAYANDAMARIMHTTNPEELIGRPFIELFAEPDRAPMAESLARLDQEAGPGARADRQIVALDGKIVDVDLRAASYRFDEAVYMQVTIRDNSVRKAIHRRVLEINVELERRVNERTAELQAANRELEAFSYSVAHDLRAPLRAIDGFTRILGEDLGSQIDASMRRSLDRVRANVARMAQLIDDLLAFARVGRRELELEAVDTGALCRAVAEELKGAYPNTAVRIDPLPVVQGDATLLRQVFANLMGNALKFSARSESPLVEVGCAATNGDHIIYVRDNGVGFSMDYAHKLFGVFQRLHGPQEFEGTGVGLAIVQRSVQRHGGRVWAEGEPSKGATFYVALPA